MTRLRWLFAILAILIATAGPSTAADLRDKAGLFSAEAVKKAETDLARIEREYSVPVSIETVESLDGRSIDDVLPEHAKAADVKGLYVLIAKKEHKVEAESYKGFAKHLTKSRNMAVRDAFTREFKAGNFDDGLTKGVDKIDSTLSEARAESGGTLRSTVAPAGRRGGQVQVPAGRGIPGKPSSFGGMGMLLSIGLGILALFLVIRVLGALFGGGNRGYANNQRMGGMGPGGMGGPGYGPGYGGGGGGGGGFMSSMFGGIGGALAGNWLYDQFSGRHQDTSMNQSNYDAGAGIPQETPGPDYVGPNDGGSDWGAGGGDAGGDWGGGGDTGGGGGDWGGGGGGDDGGSW